jgi:hypothetical protein
MESISAAWLYPIILVAGALQAWGPPMNGVLKDSLPNPWLASLVSFLPVIALLGVLWFCLPRPLPTVEGIGAMPWWAPLGGVIGAFAVIAGLLRGQGRRRRLRGPDDHGQHSHVARHRPFRTVWRSTAFDWSGPGDRRRADGGRYLRHLKILSAPAAFHICTDHRGNIDPVFKGATVWMATKAAKFREVRAPKVRHGRSTVRCAGILAGLAGRGGFALVRDGAVVRKS